MKYFMGSLFVYICKMFFLNFAWRDLGTTIYMKFLNFMYAYIYRLRNGVV